MPPLRPAIASFSRGYVCSSCLTKLQRPPYIPWLTRSATSGRKQVGQPKTKTPPTPEAPPEYNVSFSHYQKGQDGSLYNDNEELDRLQHAVDSQIKEIEDDLGGRDSVKGSPVGDIDEQLLFFESFAEALSKEAPDLLPKDTLNVLSEVQTPAPSNETLSSDQRDAKVNARELHVAIPRSKYAPGGQAHIAHLNDALSKAAEKPFSNRKDLWRWYSLSRKALSTGWQYIPESIWQILWREFSVESEENPDRMAHIQILGEDMEAASINLRPEQTMLFIEAMFLNERFEEAIARWEALRPSVTLLDSTAIPYWALGIRMLANAAQPQKAQEAADILFNDFKADHESRALISLVRSWLKSEDIGAIQRAWAIYVRLRSRFGCNMEMQDFDDVATLFFEADRPDLALAVFRDMMISRDPLAKSFDSVILYKREMGCKSLKSFAPNCDELIWRSADPFTVLPRKFNNKYFFGSWIKKLVGDGQIDSAAKVVELMCQRHIRPDAMYLNGILGAWFRSGLEQNQEKAATMAWKMIQARLEFVRNRALKKRHFEGRVRAVEQLPKEDFSRPSLLWSPATANIETFTVLIQHYQSLGQKEHVQELLNTIGAAEVRPNTTFLNGLLELGTAIHHRRWMWSLYARYVQVGGVLPNQYTFTLLWSSMKENVDPVLSVSSSRAGFPSCRELFAELVKYAPAMRTDDSLREMYDKIILCFGLSDDQVGTAIAIRAMQRLFDMYPNEDTVRSVVFQLAKAGSRNAAGLRPRRLNLNKDAQRRITLVTKTLKYLKDERMQILKLQGVDYHGLDTVERSEESLQLLCTLLHVTAQARWKAAQADALAAGKMADTSTVDERAIVAAKQMGLPDCIPWECSIEEL
jgi:hypothetical protein